LAALQVQAVQALAAIVAPGNPLAITALGRLPPKPEAHRVFFDGWMTFVSVGFEASIPLYKRAIELDPHYFHPLIGLEVAYRNLGRWAEADSLCRIIEKKLEDAALVSRLEAELFCANTRTKDRTEIEIARDLSRVWPGHNYLLGLRLLNANRPREAAEVFAKYDTAWGIIFRGWENRNARFWAMALHITGRHSVELNLVRDVRQRFPDGPGLILQEISSLIAMKRIDEARRTIEDRLALGTAPGLLLLEAGREFDAHGHPDLAEEFWRRALEWYASRPAEELATADNRERRTGLLLYLGRLAEADSLLTSVGPESPDDVQHFGYLGVLRAKMRDRDAAERISHELAAMNPPGWDGHNTEWRAEIAAQLGDLDEAVRLLRQAMEEGWPVRDYAHRYPFLKPLRGYPAFEPFLHPKG
jgi:tetratricopeptide (TPR) repeat protein